MSDTITITRKFVLIPIESDSNIWKKKVYTFSNEKLKELEEIKTKLTNKLKKAEEEQKDEIQKKIQLIISKIENYKKCQQEMEDGIFEKNMINDYAFNLVREAMESEARRKNYILSWIFSEMTTHGVQFMKTDKEKYEFIQSTINYAYRKNNSKDGSLFNNTDIQNILQGYGMGFCQELTKKIKDSVKKGLLEGKVTLPTYKINSPFYVKNAFFSITHDYDSYDELCEHIKEGKIYLNYGGSGNPHIAKFIIDVGDKGNKEELYTTLLRIINGTYKTADSSIQLTKNGKKIIINLSLKIPIKETQLDENVILGVDLGMKVPAYIALNNDNDKGKEIGCGDAILDFKNKIQAQRKRAYKSSKQNRGGHGTKKKLKSAYKFSERERGYVKNFNHFVSKEVVNYAIKNHAKYIHLEDLTGIKKNKLKENKFLKDWCYYELQSFIEYKAAKYGIEVRYVKPAYTSQTCSFCRNFEEGQRDGREFKCKACGKELHADYNAARNIAMSKEFSEKKKSK